MREQLPYAMWMYHCVVRDELEHMIEWYVGMRNGFRITTGAHGKYFQKIPAGAALCDVRENIFGRRLCAPLGRRFYGVRAFSVLAREVASGLGYTYREQEEEGALAYLHGMKDCEFRLD